MHGKRCRFAKYGVRNPRQRVHDGSLWATYRMGLVAFIRNLADGKVELQMCVLIGWQHTNHVLRRPSHPTSRGAWGGVERQSLQIVP